MKKSVKLGSRQGECSSYDLPKVFLRDPILFQTMPLWYEDREQKQSINFLNHFFMFLEPKGDHPRRHLLHISRQVRWMSSEDML